MPRGLPDYYNPASSVSQRMVDLAGVLAAVAKIPPLDGRGRLAFVDTFNEGHFGWGRLNAGDGVAPVLYSLLSEISPASLRFVSGTVGGGGNSAIFRSHQVSAPIRAGFETGWYAAATASFITLLLTYTDEGNYYRAQMRLAPATGVLDVNTPTGFVTVATITPGAIAATWFPMKVVADFATHKYSHVLAGQVQYNIDTLDLVTAVSAFEGRMVFQAQVDAGGAASVTHYLGHAAITLDEP